MFLLLLNGLLFSFRRSSLILKLKRPEYKVRSLLEDDENIAFFKAKAQSEIDYFIEFLNENGSQESSYQYAVKIPFVDEDGFEHMWVEVSSYVDGVFNGRLANDPVSVKSLK